MEITKDVRYVGVNDHDIDLFEGQYVVPEGMAYNSYVIVDEKIAVIKNNQMQAVMIPIDEYERLAALAEKAEQKIIFETVQERKGTPTSEYISYEDAMKTAGL